MKSLSLTKAVLLVIGINCCMGISAEQPCTLNHEEVQYIESLIQNVQSHVSKFQECITNFITKNDGKSYREYADTLSAYLDEFERAVLCDLQTSLNNVDNHESSYYKGLNIVHELMAEIIERFKTFRTVLMKYRNGDASQATALAKALESTATNLVDDKTVDLLKNKLVELQDVIISTGEKSLINRVTEMKNLISSLSGAGVPKVSRTTIFACLSRRLRKNK